MNWRAHSVAKAGRERAGWRLLVLCGLLASLCLATPRDAAAQGQGAQTTQRATVHETPGGPVVDGVPAGRSVGVLSRQGSWAEIQYRKGSISLKGWVALSHLNLGSAAAAVPQYKAPAPERGLPKGSHVTIMTTRLDCRERIAGVGFESCSVHVRATVSLDAVPPSRPRVLLACGAEITTHDRFAPYQKVRELAKKTFPLNSIFSIHEMKIDFRFAGSVTSVDGEEVRCLLEPVK
ncbi:MAG: SH3 domain-containing protein [Alphaproteobacteria bacterium]|nr:SH3 domain-containing protein [Alphaproteobacteria bacterium]